MTTKDDQTAELTDAELEVLTAPTPPANTHVVAGVVGDVNAPASDAKASAPFVAGSAIAGGEPGKAKAPKPEKSSKSAEDALWEKAMRRNPHLRRPA